jgi:arginyl-tRNA synthetase
MIEAKIESALRHSLESYGVFEEDIALELERPKDPTHGDLSCNVALILAKKLKRKPRELAGEIAATIELDRELVESVEIAGPGFINFRYAHTALTAPIHEILEAGARFGESDFGGGERVSLEYISANPTGPLNVVSARAAAVGSTLHRVMAKAGYRPSSEFYVNNAGRQVLLFGQSLRVRYLQALGQSAEMPEDGYQGEYLTELAQGLFEHGVEDLDFSATEAGRVVGDLAIVAGGPQDWLELEEEASNRAFGVYGMAWMLKRQRATCLRYGVRFDVWYLETEIHSSGKIEKALKLLRDGGHVYEEDGAVWLRTTDFGDEKDRVVVRSDGTPTYFLPDIAYHVSKRDRGAEAALDFLGPDHHGYIGRMLAAMECLGYPKDWLEIVLLQQVNLIQDGKPLKMAKRAGLIVTMDELIDEVGTDVARYFFLARKNSTHLDFDLDLAKEQSNENPGWYVKYAHARICSVLRNAEAQGVKETPASEQDLELLTAESELTLCRLLPELPVLVSRTAEAKDPTRLTRYATELATAFHQFYHNCRILTEDAALTRARLALSRATRVVLANTLDLMGMEAPERM